MNASISDGPATQWLRPSDSDGLATKWLVAQLAYDRVRRVLRQDGMNSSQVEAWLENACQQVLGLPMRKLEDNHLFALHLEQTVQGNAYPHY